MEVGSEPRNVTSRRRIVYRRSAWRVHQFEMWSGELVCRAAVLRMQDSLLLWLGDGGEPALSELALALPAASMAETARGAPATTLLGADGGAAMLARRLAVALAKPVYVCCGAAFDRFTLPLVERGLVAELKSQPDCF